MSWQPRNKRSRLMVRWSLVSLIGTAITALALLYFTRPDRKAVDAAHGDVEGLTSVLSKSFGQDKVPFAFQDVTEALGVDFVHFPAKRRSLLPEDMGSGVACGDFDRDGFVDLFFVNFSGSIHTGEAGDSGQGSCRLYKNLEGKRFVDVTGEAGIEWVGYGMGAAWGDYDNDGFLDLYVTAFGGNVLFHNQQDGSFRDVTREANVADERFSSGCSWGDFDRDGNLDLYVCNYVTFELDSNQQQSVALQYDTEQPFTLNPSSYPAQKNSLFRNLGNGRFEEVGDLAGVVDGEARSLSASWVDLNGDGWSDLYVANDVSKNDVYLNLGNGTFRDIGMSSLAADYRGAMGLAVGDFDNDLDQDLFVSHWIAQENALYQNMTTTRASGFKVKQKKLWFVDVADQVGLGQDSLDLIGWAAGFADFDNDGWRDLWVVNGSTFEEPTDHRQLRSQQFRLYWNREEKGYVNVAEAMSGGLAKPFVGRGGAQLDFDRDGRMDLIVVSHGSRARIFRNRAPQVGNWIRIQLKQKGGNTDAVGSKVYLTSQGRTQMGEVGASSSYLSQDELPLHFGVGDWNLPVEVKIVWPDGVEETRPGVKLNQEHLFVHEIQAVENTVGESTP